MKKLVGRNVGRRAAIKLPAAFLLPVPLLGASLTSSNVRAAGRNVKWGEFEFEVGSIPFFQALRAKTFSNGGIDLDITTFGTGPSKLAAAVSNSINMGTIGPPGMIAWDKGARLKFVSSGWISKIYFFLVASPTVTSIPDLVGKKVGINGFGSGYDIALRAILSVHGIGRPGQVDVVALGSEAAALAALKRGAIAAAILKEPSVSLCEYESIGRVIASSWDYLPDFHQTSIFCTDSFLKSNPEEVRTFLSIYWKNQADFLRDLDGAARFGSEMSGYPVPVIRSAIERFLPYWRTRGEIVKTEFENCSTTLLNLGLISRKIEFDEMVDLSFLPA